MWQSEAVDDVLLFGRELDDSCVFEKALNTSVNTREDTHNPHKIESSRIIIVET
jgi:hypothetical protein